MRYIDLKNKMKWILCFCILLFVSSCFFGGIKNPGKVRAYVPGQIKTDKGSYGVGILPNTWRQKHVGRYKALVLYNESYQSTIESDAFCDRSFDDASLKVLTNHLHVGISEQKIKKETNLMLDGRGAFRSVISGKVDGVEVVLDSVVIKKDNCLFDFVLISIPGEYSRALSDFENFFGGFRYYGDI